MGWQCAGLLVASGAAEAPNFWRLTLPILFFHTTNDTVCDTTQSWLAESLREDCADLTEVTIDSGLELMFKRPDAVNEAIVDWLAAHL